MNVGIALIVIGLGNNCDNLGIKGSLRMYRHIRRR